jgi:ABC-type polysaccharide/polyol phosphate transport system ATPase subunit
MFGVVGSNGSGKSTLLKLLAGIYRADEGTLECRGRVTSLIELGAGFHPDLTGRENILINGLLIGLTRSYIRRVTDDIIAFSGLERFVDSPVRTYSSGIYMRLGFAIAAHASPDILLVDEILAVGDEYFQHRCLGKINDFRREGRTILLVSHDLGTVARHCDRILWIDRGAVRGLGHPRQMIDAYLETVEEQEAARVMASHHRMVVRDAPGGGKRWGSGEVQITSVRMEDPAGGERYLYHTGEAARIRIGWRVPGEPVDQAVFGVAFQRDDGVTCYGTNTRIEGIEMPRLAGEGEILLEIGDLSLLAGSYRFDVAVHRPDEYPYDFHSRMYGFEVRSALRDLGVARIPHRWVVP